MLADEELIECACTEPGGVPDSAEALAQRVLKSDYDITKTGDLDAGPPSAVMNVEPTWVPVELGFFHERVFQRTGVGLLCFDGSPLPVPLELVEAVGRFLECDIPTTFL